MRLGLAFRCFFKALRDKSFAAKVEPLIQPASLPEPARPNGEPLRLLAVLQRDGRLLDFLNEDLSTYDDSQIGAAVRDIHRDCKAALAKYVDVAPVLDHPEGEMVAVPAGFNPAHIRLTGNVAGQPPFRGALAHRGWRATAQRIPPVEVGSELLLAPAEVEIP